MELELVQHYPRDAPPPGSYPSSPFNASSQYNASDSNGTGTLAGGGAAAASAAVAGVVATRSTIRRHFDWAGVRSPLLTRTRMFQRIVVKNVNEAPVIAIGEAGAVRSMPEATAAGTVVPGGPLTAWDGDPGDVVTFTAVGGSGEIEVNTTSGELRVAAGAALDYEKAGGMTAWIRVRATDTGGLYDEKTITVDVLPVNEAPSFTGGGKHEPGVRVVREGASPGTVVGLPLFAFDPDLPKQQVSFSLTPRGDASAKACAKIEGGAGSRAAAQAGANLDALYTAAAAGNVPFAISSGGQITVVDVGGVDRAVPLDYAVDNTTMAWPVRAGGTGGVSTTRVWLDYEVVTSYTFGVDVSDDASPPMKDTKCVTVHVADVNEPPTLKLPRYVSSFKTLTAHQLGGAIPENVLVGGVTSGLAIQFTDADGNDGDAELKREVVAVEGQPLAPFDVGPWGTTKIQYIFSELV